MDKIKFLIAWILAIVCVVVVLYPSCYYTLVIFAILLLSIFIFYKIQYNGELPDSTKNIDKNKMSILEKLKRTLSNPQPAVVLSNPIPASSDVSSTVSKLIDTVSSAVMGDQGDQGDKDNKVLDCSAEELPENIPNTDDYYDSLLRQDLVNPSENNVDLAYPVNTDVYIDDQHDAYNILDDLSGKYKISADAQIANRMKYMGLKNKHSINNAIRSRQNFDKQKHWFMEELMEHGNKVWWENTDQLDL